MVVNSRTTAVNDIIYSIITADDEGDDITMVSLCAQDPCPFQINAGEVSYLLDIINNFFY